jgi:hypothetical protein
MSTSSIKGWGTGVAFLASGLVAGGVLAGTLSANAATPTPSPSAGTTQQAPGGPADQTRPQRPDEQLLTGDAVSKVRAAVLAKYPGATIHRLETDSDGAYEAHILTKDGKRLTVEVDKAFKVTGTEAQRDCSGGRGQGGPPPGAPSTSGSST